MKKIFAILLALCTLALPAAAQEYVVVGKTTNVYTEPSTSTPLLNQWDDNVDLLPGMAFENKGEKGDYYIIDIPGWNGLFLPKSACVTPDEFDFAPGVYQFKYESDTFPLTFTRSGDNAYDVTGYRNDLKAQATPTVVVITWDGDMYGCVTRINGDTYVWLYDTVVLPWN